MPEWIVSLFGESLAPIVWVVIVAAMVCLLAVALIIIAKKLFGSGGLPASFKSRVPRLAVLDMTRIDEKRRLVLVRRDEVEHLILIGGQTDIVVEPGILRLPASNLERIDTRSEGLAGPDRPREPVVPDFDRGSRESAAWRDERATPRPEGDRTSAGPRIESRSPIAAPSPSPSPPQAPTQPKAAELRQATQRAGATDRRDPPIATPSPTKDVEEEATIEPSRPSGDRLVTRLSNPIGNATAALAAAMPGLVRSRSEQVFDPSKEEATARVGAPRSLATPTLPTPSDDVVSSTPPVPASSTLGVRSAGSAPPVSLDRSSRSFSQASPERITSLPPASARADQMTDPAQAEDTLGTDASLIPTEGGDRRAFSTLPTASALGEARLAAVSAAASERTSARTGRNGDSGAPAASGAGDESPPADSVSENVEANAPRMPLSVKSFATAIQNRKAPQQLGAAGRAPASPSPSPSRSPSVGDSKPAPTPTLESAAEAPTATKIPEREQGETEDDAPASSSHSPSGVTADSAALADRSRAGPPAVEETAQRPVATEQSLSPDAASDGIEDGDLEDFLSNELRSGFDHTGENVEPLRPSQGLQSDISGNQGQHGARENPWPAAASAPETSDDRLSPSAPSKAPQAGTSVPDSVTDSAMHTEVESSDRVTASTSNWSAEADVAEAAAEPSPPKSLPMQEPSTNVDTPKSENRAQCGAAAGSDRFAWQDR